MQTVQGQPESDVWSGSALLAYIRSFQNVKEIVNYYQETLKFELSNW